MGILQFVLLFLSATLLVVGGLFYFLSCRKKLDIYLSVSLFLVAAGLFHSFYFLVPPQDRLSFILLLPLKLSFAPFYFLVRFVSGRYEDFRLPAAWYKVLGVASAAEVLAYMLPLGALGYTGSYSRKILEYMFGVQTGIYVCFFAAAIITSVLYVMSLRGSAGSGGVRSLFRSAPGMTALSVGICLVGVMTLVSVVLPYSGLQSTVIYFLPQMAAGIILCIFALAQFGGRHALCVAAEGGGTSDRPVLSDTAARAIAILKEEKLYLDPCLRIGDVAERMSLSPNYLSRVINEETGEGFNDIVNRMRVDSVTDKIMKGECASKTLYSLGQEAGFSSKSTFNAAFRKFTGKTPSEFRKGL